MYKSVKEILIEVRHSSLNDSNKILAKSLLNYLEKGLVPKSKELSTECFVSESVVTSFAKRLGYEGYRELQMRLKIESEYYSIQTVKQNAQTHLDENGHFSWYKDFLLDLKYINDQKREVMSFVSGIKNAENIYIISCYQQIFNASQFAEQLQLLQYNTFFNINRKANTAWVERTTDKDIAIFLVFGLDNDYVMEFYDNIRKKGTKTFIICSPSQKIKMYDFESLLEIKVSGNTGALETARSAVINYIFNEMLVNL